MAPDDSTRCLRCRNPKSAIVDDGRNPPFRLCRYCQEALAGNVTIIDRPLKEPSVRAVTRSNPKSTNKFWRMRKQVTGR